MKKKILPLLTLTIAGTLLAGTALAQERTPAPEEKTAPAEAFPEDNMPVLRSDITPMRMPSPGMQGGVFNPKTGKYILYNDSKTGLGYNFEKQEIIDYKTGKVYKFSDHPAYKGPKPEPKKKG